MKRPTFPPNREIREGGDFDAVMVTCAIVALLVSVGLLAWIFWTLRTLR